MTPAHVRWCDGTVAVDAVKAVSDQSPEIVVRQEPVPEASLPDFVSPEPTKPPTHPSASSAPGTSFSPPPGAAVVQPFVIPAAQVTRPIVDLICDQLEVRLQQAEGVWKPSRPKPIPDKDREALSTLYGLVLEKHLPAAWMQKWGLEVAALLLTVTVLVPKVFEYRNYYADMMKKKKSEPKDTAGVNLSPNGGPVDAWKEQYALAQREGRAPS